MLRKFVLDLDSVYSKRINFNGRGFFIKAVIPGMEAYIIMNDDPATTINLAVQTNVPRKQFRTFTFTNTVALPGKKLNLYVAETDNDFDNLPSDSNAGVEGNLTETNVILNEISGKITQVDTQNVKLTSESVGLAKETTLTNIKTNTDILVSSVGGGATETTLSDVKDITEIIKNNTDGLETLQTNIWDILANLYISNYVDYSLKSKHIWYHMNTYSGNKNIAVTNPTGSGKKVYISVLKTGNLDSSDLTFNIVYNPTIDTSTPMNLFSKNHGFTGSPTVQLLDVTAFTGGGAQGSEIIPGSNFFNAGTNQTSLIEVQEGITIMYQFLNSNQYNFLINIIEE